MTITTPARDKVDRALRDGTVYTLGETITMLDDLQQEVRNNDAKTADSDGWQYLRDVLAYMQQGGKLTSVEATVTEAIQRIGRQQQPRRGDAVDVWLKAHRDTHTRPSVEWCAVDETLDDYRLHADTRTPLGKHVCENGNIDDCVGCYEEAQRGR